MRKTTKTAVLRLDKVTKEYLALEKKHDRTRAEQRKFNEISDEIEVITRVFSPIFDINLRIKESRLIDKKDREVAEVIAELNSELEAEKEKLSSTIEFQQLAVGGMLKKIKEDTTLSHLVIMDAIKSQILNKIDTTLHFINQNKTEYLKESIVSEALMQGAEIGHKGVLIVPTNISNELKEKLKVYGHNVEFKLI